MIPKIPAWKAALILTGLVLAGCSSTTVPVAAEPDLVGTRIAQAAEKASKAMDAISGIEQQRTPLPPEEDFSSAPQGLMEPITVRWSGPIEQITQTLASRAGLRFQTQGRPAPVPITVVVDVYQKPMMDVLRSVGLQAGQRADLSVDAQQNVITLHYAPVDKL